MWDGAYEIVRRRMEDNRQLLADPDPTIHYATEPPARTDDGDDAAPDAGNGIPPREELGV